jgi:hypothetical protein
MWQMTDMLGKICTFVKEISWWKQSSVTNASKSSDLDPSVGVMYGLLHEGRPPVISVLYRGSKQPLGLS